jgi:hypothetical protein
MSTFGLAPDEIWRQALDDIVNLSRRAERTCGDLASRIADLMQSSAGPVPAVVRQAVLAAEERLLYTRAAAWQQDGGYQGVLASIQTAIAMCDQAIADWEIELGPPAGAYGYVDTNPYHLVAGSYLAAVGVTGAIVQLLDQTSAELAMAAKLAHDQASHPLGELVTAGIG